MIRKSRLRSTQHGVDSRVETTYNPKSKRHQESHFIILGTFLLTLSALFYIFKSQRIEDTHPLTIQNWSSHMQKLHDVWEFSNICIQPTLPGRWNFHLFNTDTETYKGITLCSRIDIFP